MVIAAGFRQECRNTIVGNTMNKAPSWLVLAALCATAAAAEAPQPAVAKVIDCSKVQDSLQRLTCYDREAAALSKGVAPAPAAAAAPAAAPSAPGAKAKSPGMFAKAKSAVGSVFGGSVAAPEAAATPAKAAAGAPAAFGAEQIAKKPSEVKKELQSQELKAIVETLRETVPDTWLFTLDNGQVWRQDEVRVGFMPEEGDEVTIRKGSLGSYRLSLDKDGTKSWVRATRVQ